MLNRLISLALLVAATGPFAIAQERPVTFSGTQATVYSSGAMVLPRTGYYITSGSIPAAKVPQLPIQSPARWEPDLYGQAVSTMHRLSANLAEVGLTPKDVIAVRAYLVPGEDGTVDWAGWNRAYGEFFNNYTNPIKPVRTSVAIPTLALEGLLIEIEWVAVFPSGQGPYSEPNYTSGNPMIYNYGSPTSFIDSGKAIHPNAALYWTAGTVPAPLNPEASQEDPGYYGNTYDQGVSALRRIESNLAAVGLTMADVIFLRVFLAPEKLYDGRYRFDLWNQAYGEFFNTPYNPHKPARTTVMAPLYSRPGMSVEVEALAAFPDARGPFTSIDLTSANKNLKSYGRSSSSIASGKAVARHTGLYWSSGAIYPSADDLYGQATGALRKLQLELSSQGLSMKDVVFLRAYIVPDAETGELDFASWSRAYGDFFANDLQPEKPARTSIAVSALPGEGTLIEIDLIAASGK